MSQGDVYSRCALCRRVVVQTAAGWEKVDPQTGKPTGAYSKPDERRIAHAHRPTFSGDGEIIECTATGKPI